MQQGLRERTFDGHQVDPRLKAEISSPSAFATPGPEA